MPVSAHRRPDKRLYQKPISSVHGCVSPTSILNQDKGRPVLKPRVLSPNSTLSYHIRSEGRSKPLSPYSLVLNFRFPVQMEMPIVDPGALRRVYRDGTLTLSDTVAHRRNVDGSTAAESCCICLEGWEIGEEVVTLRCECTHWTH